MKPLMIAVVLLMLVVLSEVIGCGQHPARSALDSDPPNTLLQLSDQDHGSAVDPPLSEKKIEEAYRKYRVGEMRKDFPIKAGMSVRELDDLLKQRDRMGFGLDFDFDTMYGLVHEKRHIQDGDGWIYFWVNGKHLLHCDLMIEDGHVKSVWVMPGNREWVAGFYFRLSGTGRHDIEGLLIPDPSVIKSDEQLRALQTSSHMRSLSF